MDLNRNIFILWLQGWEHAPEITKQCLESWERLNPTWNIIKLSKDNSFVGTEGWAFEGYDDDTKYISCCENAKNDILNKIITEVKMSKSLEKSNKK